MEIIFPVFAIMSLLSPECIEKELPTLNAEGSKMKIYLGPNPCTADRLLTLPSSTGQGLELAPKQHLPHPSGYNLSPHGTMLQALNLGPSARGQSFSPSLRGLSLYLTSRWFSPSQENVGGGT